jgi:hypothetical protein
LAAPWLLGGQAYNLLCAIVPHAGPRVSVSAYNGWYLLLFGRVHNVSSLLHPLSLPLAYREIGMVLYGLFTAGVLVLVWRDRARNLALPAAVLALGMFNLLTEIHERFLFPSVALLALASAAAARESSPRLGWAYAALSATFLFNLVTIAPFTPVWGGNLVALQAQTPIAQALKALALLAAAVNLLVMVALSIALLRRSHAAPHRLPMPGAAGSLT